MKSSGRSGFALTLLLVLCARGASATTAEPVDLKSCVDAAGAIFAGTVTHMVAVMDSGTIITRVTFSDVAHVRGEPDSGDIILKVYGGQVGRVKASEPGAPKFEKGVRYVVLAKDDLGSARNAYSPIVYFNQGLFTVKPERPSGPAVVHAGLPIAAYRDGHVVVVARPTPGDSMPGSESTGASAHGRSRTRGASDLKPFVGFGLGGRVAYEVLNSRADPGTRFSEEQFLALLREIGKSR